MNEPQTTAIPKEFYSATTHAPFDSCLACGVNVLDGSTVYLIEKAIKTYPGYDAKDTLFDYAICMACAEDVHKQLSKESMGKIEAYFAEHVDMQAKIKSVQMDDPTSLTRKCLIKNTDRNESREYQLYAQCIGDQIILDHPPYMICGEAMEEIMDVLSKETKEVLGGFLDEHFSPDPDLFSTDPSRTLILV